MADQITEAQHCCLDIMAMTCGQDHWTDQMKRAVIHRLNMAIDLAAKRKVAESECSRLASRVEELEKGLQEIVDDGCEGCYEVAKRVLSKHPDSPRPTDSASHSASEDTSSEIRKALQVLLRRAQMVDEIGACVFCREILWSKYGVRFPTEHADDCLYTIAQKEIR